MRSARYWGQTFECTLKLDQTDSETDTNTDTNTDSLPTETKKVEEQTQEQTLALPQHRGTRLRRGLYSPRRNPGSLMLVSVIQAQMGLLPKAFWAKGTTKGERTSRCSLTVNWRHVKRKLSKLVEHMLFHLYGRRLIQKSDLMQLNE